MTKTNPSEYTESIINVIKKLGSATCKVSNDLNCEIFEEKTRIIVDVIEIDLKYSKSFVYFADCDGFIFRYAKLY